MNPAIQKLVTLAKSQVGVKEEGGNNRGTRVVEYQGATWLQPGAWPWCAAFTCWLMREWLEEDDVREYLRVHFKRNTLSLAETEKVRCRDASAFGWEKWARSKELQILPESSLARAGDFVVFDFSHIGLVVEDQHNITDNIKTIEGNTNKKGERESQTIDGVWEKSRAPSLTRCYIRIFK